MSEGQIPEDQDGKGFIAAWTKRGHSPKALQLYGINEDAYSDDDEMFPLMHEMRIVSSPAEFSTVIGILAHPVRGHDG